MSLHKPIALDGIIVSQHEMPFDFQHSTYPMLQQLPLPGIIILVHGVNSDGEWYEQTEQGLCAGLNQRLARGDHQLAHTGTEAGQLRPVKYAEELTTDGYINPKVNSNKLIEDQGSFSPVIRFRWGYKACAEELQQFGDSIYLNEEDYWGGGPFANGCTALPDLWNEGLAESLFLFMQVQHMNPLNERQVYACPPRAYYVMAAYRLAKLVESIRRQQADVPITIVCHSQGNMIGMAAAFLGDRMPKVSDGVGGSGPCVADNYVLCNPPYSLVESNFTESWSQQHMRDGRGHSGRQTHAARVATLAAFFEIIRGRKALADQQTAARINRRMKNERHGFTAERDASRYGLGGSTYGRVTLYCNPHDQVISSITVQGIGWRGLRGPCGLRELRGLCGKGQFDEIAATRAEGVFVQRVFAQNFEVGKQGSYHYWKNHWRAPEPGNADFWFPHSKIALYSLGKGLEASKNWFSYTFTILAWPLMAAATAIARPRINQLPPDDWAIPLTAPNLPEPFKPQALRFGLASECFDQGYDAPGASRDKHRARGQNDPYAGDHQLPAYNIKGGAPGDKTDSPQGNSEDEAGLRYEHHALLRMRARRAGLYKNDQKVVEEDNPERAGEKYKAWRGRQIKSSLENSVDAVATDHSSIMTNPMHAQKALAYDVAIGVCDISPQELRKLRVAADWRCLKTLPNDEINFKFYEYFSFGTMKDLQVYLWATRADSEAKMPKKINDQR